MTKEIVETYSNGNFLVRYTNGTDSILMVQNTSEGTHSSDGSLNNIHNVDLKKRF